MKKIILLTASFFIVLLANAQLEIKNNTCVTITVTSFCSDATYTSCGSLESLGYTIPGYGSSQTVASPSSLNPFFTPPLNTYPPTYSIGSSSSFDAVKFSANDGLGCYENVVVGGCGGLPTTFNGSCHFCGQQGLNATWVTVGSAIYVTINN